MPAAQQETHKQQSLNTQRVVAYMKMAQETEELWHAILIFLGALFLLGSIPFYPVYLVFFIALLCGGIGYKSPQAGVVLGVILALPAVAYQSAMFGWIYLLIIALVLFEVFEQWAIIAVLEILILAPFAFGRLFFGWITILGMAIGAFHFGSKKSLLISIPSVFAILLLSSIWLVDTGYFPIALGMHQPGNADLLFQKPPVEVFELGEKAIGAVFGLLATENTAKLWDVVGQFITSIFKVLFADSGLVQLIGWGITLALMSWLSGMFKQKYSSAISSCALLFALLVHFGIGILWAVGFRIELAVAVVGTIAVVGLLDHLGVKVSRETEVSRAEQMKSFGKFGLQDMGLAKGEKGLDAVGGYEDVKQELRDAILIPLEKKDIAIAYGIKPPTGILLFGPPGTGKTMLMRALSGELKYGFYYVKSSDLLSMWVGESEKNVAELFSIARSKAPCILFFDEIDAIGKKRGASVSDDVGPRVLTMLLQEMDGMPKTAKNPVLIMAATNIPNQLDPALLRPGRFDKIVYMHLPDKPARKAIFKVSLKGAPVAPDIDFDKLVAKTERFSGADIKNIAQEAVKLAAKEAIRTGNLVPVSMNYLMTIVNMVKPSTSLAAIEDYEKFRLDFERRSGAKEEEKKEEATKWTDVVGLDEIKKALLETIELPLLHEAEMKEFKVKPTKGILLFGPPGTGKTLIVKAACNELKASFQVLGGAELMKQGYTQAVTVIKETFNRARENTPAILFVDEIETFAPARGISSSEIVGQFLTEMDGLKELKGVVVIAATNRPAVLDPAILRPGRFDKIFYIPPPDEKGRIDMFRLYLGRFAEGLDFARAARMTPGFSGADLAALCQTVKMDALRTKLAGGEPKITEEMLLVIISKRRPSITQELLDEYEDFKQKYGERK